MVEKCLFKVIFASGVEKHLFNLFPYQAFLKLPSSQLSADKKSFALLLVNFCVPLVWNCSYFFRCHGGWKAEHDLPALLGSITTFSYLDIGFCFPHV